MISRCTCFALLVLLVSSCAQKPPLTVQISDGIFLNLPSGWEETTVDQPDSIALRNFKQGKTQLTIAVEAARDIAFSRQVSQDRNNLNQRSEYKLLMERQFEAGGRPGHMFIITMVEDGIRYKAKTVLIQAGTALIYITLKAQPDSFEDAVTIINQFLAQWESQPAANG